MNTQDVVEKIVKEDEIYCQIKKKMDDEGIDYGEINNRLYIAAMRAALMERIPPAEAQENWEKAMGLLQNDEKLEHWYNNFEVKKQREKIEKANTRLDQNKFNLAWNNFDEIIETDYRAYKDYRLDADPNDRKRPYFHRVTDKHLTRVAECKRIFEKDKIQIWSGKSSTGKTLLAICLGRIAAKMGWQVGLEKFGYVSSLFSSHLTRNKEYKEKPPSSHITDLMKQYDLFIIDEYIAKEAHFISENVFELLDRFSVNGKCCVLISNDELENILASFGRKRNPLERRIYQYGRVVDFWDIEPWKK